MGFFSFQENRCGLCRVSFDKQDAYEQHVDAVHSNLWLKILGVSMVLLIAGGAFYYYVFVRPQMMINPANYSGAQPGDHWHANYTVVVCGETKQPFLYSQGDIHTHGNGRIHIHPHSANSAGPEANLQNFIESVGGSMTNHSLVIPGWGIDSSKGCDGKKSEFNVYVNGYKVKNPTNYTPQNGDSIQFAIERNGEQEGTS